MIANAHPRCPVDQNNEDVRVIAEDSDGFGAICNRFQYVAAEGDVCLSMGDDTVKLVDKFDVVWKGIAAYNIVKQILIPGIVKNNFSTWKWGVWG